MDLRHQLGIVRKWLPLLVACVVIAAAAAFALSSIQQRIYQAKTTLIVGQSLQALNPDYNQLMVSQRLSSTYAAVATKRPALESVIERLRPRDRLRTSSPRRYGRRPRPTAHC